MKKFLMLLVLTLAVPALAAPAVSITIQDLGSGWAAINYSATECNVVAFGLNVSVNSSAKITGIRNYKTGESGGASKGFGIFPGTITIDGSGNVTSWGTPIAPNSDPGAAGTGLGTGTVVLELGALYTPDTNKPAMSGKLCELQVSGCCAMSVAVNSTRAGKTSGGLDAGVVLDDATALVPTLASNVAINFNCGCACLGDINGDLLVSKADISSLVTWIGNNTTAPFWRKTGMTGSCMDINKDNIVSKADISALVTWIGNNTTAPFWRKACSIGHP